MRKLLECIIASKEGFLLKNRDRAYKPSLGIYRYIQKDSSEIVFLFDYITGWAEGMNSKGVGIVNSALVVQRDEREHVIARKKGKKSADGNIIIKALQKDDIKDIIDTILNYKGGLQGHTFINYKGVLYKIEKIPGKFSIRKSQSNKFFVRTNHGFDFPKEGYASGVGYLSTRFRLKHAIKKLKDSDPESWSEKLLIQDYDPTSSLNTVRDAKLFTSSQLLLDIKNKIFKLYLIEGKVKFKGIKTINKFDVPDKEIIKISVETVRPISKREYSI